MRHFTLTSRAASVFEGAAPDHARPLHRTPAVRAILRAPRIQPRLTIGAVNDPAEREADRVADEVMRMPERDVAAGDAGPPLAYTYPAGTVVAVTFDGNGRSATEQTGSAPGASDGPSVIRRQPAVETPVDQNIDDYHVAVRGDTYWDLARAHGVSVRDMMLWNPFPPRAIPIGERLRIEEPKILLTYFNAYPGSPVNRSEQTVQSAPSEIGALETRYGVEIDTHRIDVSVSRPEGVDAFIDQYVENNRRDYDVIVSTGEGDANIFLETAAGNAIETDFPDNSGRSQRGVRVDTSLSGSHLFRGNIMNDPGQRREFEHQISGTPAGEAYQSGTGLNESEPDSRYLCNYLTGHLITQSGRPHSLLAAQFIHLSDDATRLRENREFTIAFLTFVLSQRIYNTE